jgi:hypothetical protein
VQHLPGNLAGFHQIDDRIHDVFYFGNSKPDANQTAGILFAAEATLCKSCLALPSAKSAIALVEDRHYVDEARPTPA